MFLRCLVPAGYQLFGNSDLSGTGGALSESDEVVAVEPAESDAVSVASVESSRKTPMQRNLSYRSASKSSMDMSQSARSDLLRNCLSRPAVI